MKKIINLILVISVILWIFPPRSWGELYSKIDPKLRMIIDHPQLSKVYRQHPFYLAKSDQIQRVRMILKTGLDDASLRKAGLHVRARIGDIVTATGSIDRLSELAQLPGIGYIQAPDHLRSTTNISIPEMQAPAIYQNYGTYGTGIIIGIIDTGIDWKHPDFRKSNGSTRIKYLLDFSDPGDIDGDEDLDGPDAYGGTLYSEQEINNALDGIGSIGQDDVVGHGTHVAGCAAGNGFATGGGYPSRTYVGVAPEADLVIVKATRVQGSTNFMSDDYISALKFIDDVARSEGKPYVANLSLGGNDGPHDGTSLGEQAIDQLIGPGIPGKAVVVAAGNDGDVAIHASGTFTSTLTSIDTKFKVNTYENNPGTYDDYLLFEVWYDGTASQSIKLKAPDGSSYGPVNRRSTWSNNTVNGAIVIDNASSGASPLNSDNQIVIQIFDYEQGKTPRAGEWTITITGNSGRFDMWLTLSSMSASFTSNIDKTMHVSTPGTANNVITVGSYVTKNSWMDLDGRSVAPVPLPQLYTASSFSSSGPSRDLRTKPEICAPGEWIASTYSSFAPPNGQYSMFDTENNDLPNGFIMQDGKHAMAQGTSFAAPHVAGLIALILQKFPQSDAMDIKEAITGAARLDAYTTSTSKWGYGKLDGYTTMNRLAGIVPEKKLSLSIFQNPAITQYIDFYLIAKYALESIPTATIRMNNGTTSPVSMKETQPKIYQGEYKFSTDGTALLTVNAKINGESPSTLTKYFGVQLLKANLSGLFRFGDITLLTPRLAISEDTYFTMIPVEYERIPPGLEPIGTAYRIGPANIRLNQAATVSFIFPDSYREAAAIGVYLMDDESWTKLKTLANEKTGEVTAALTQLGTVGLFYDPDMNNADALPSGFELRQNYPNPFNARTIIAYQLPEHAHVRLKIFNIKGELVRTLRDGETASGSHAIVWDGADDHHQFLPTGVYICHLSAGRHSETHKMLLLK